MLELCSRCCATLSTAAVINVLLQRNMLMRAGRRSWSLDYILNTHHHHDHVGGNSYLKGVYGSTIVGFAGDAERIPLMDVGVTEASTVQVGDLVFQVMEVPGALAAAILQTNEHAKSLRHVHSLSSEAVHAN